MKRVKNAKENRELKQGHHLKNDPESSQNELMPLNETINMNIDTPFYPRTKEHTALLEKARTGEQVTRLLLHLQRSYGNAYVQRLLRTSNIQTKLTVSHPGDIYEQEADRVAEEVTKSINAPVQRQTPEEEEELQMQEDEEEELAQTTPDLQRQEEEEEEEPVQMMPDLQHQEDEEEELVQMKSDLQRQEEEEEEEEPIQMMPDLQHQEDEEEELVQMKPDLQYQEEEEEEEEEAVQMKPNEKSVTIVANEIETRINSAKSNGRPLSSEAIRPMEQAFRSDFSDVRIHTDSEADKLNKQLNAKAFTTGQDIFFQEGEYKPTTSEGQRLLAHELTHTIQQTGNRELKHSDDQITPHLLRELATYRAKEKTPPPVPTNKPWKQNNSPKATTVKIQELVRTGADTGSGLKDSELINVADFAGGIKNVADSKGKKEITEYVDITGTIGSYGVKGASFVLDQVNSKLKENSAASGIVGAVKEILGPIPDAISTVVNIIKAIYAAVQKKGKEAWEAVWESAKSGIQTIFSTISTVFNLIGTLGGYVPIVGGVAGMISAFISFGESAYGMAKRILKWISIKKLIAKITEKFQQPEISSKGKTEGGGEKGRLVYMHEINVKRMKNIKRELGDKFTGLISSSAQMVSAILKLVGGIVALGGVTAPVGAIISAFGTVADVFATVVSVIGKMGIYVPKALHWLRQKGRDIAGKQNIFGKMARGLGFNAGKSSTKKDEKRKEVVTSLVDDVSKIKTEFELPGKDPSVILGEVKTEVPKYDNLAFELEAMGVDKKELYSLNEEKSLGKRLKGQIRLIYNGLKSR